MANSVTALHLLSFPVMLFKVALLIAIALQVAAVMMAFRLHLKYKSHSAWIMICSAAALVAIQLVAMLWLLWPMTMESPAALISLWAACLSAVLVSTLFLGGFALIEPLFKELARVNEQLYGEKQQLYGEKEQLRGEKEKLESVVTQTEEELKLAREIQQNLLPKKSPDVDGFDIAGRSIPAEWTSGDYFDFIPTPAGKTSVTIADVCGHGTGPALVMAETRTLLRVMSSRGISAGEVLIAANRMLAEDIQFNRFVTAFLASIDPATRQLSYAAAGHDAVLLEANGVVRTLAAKDPPLGIDADRQMITHPTIQMNSGDVLLMMTDGIAEAVSVDGEEFGVERAIEFVAENRSRAASEIVDDLIDAAYQFAGRSNLKDDVTAVIVKVA